MRCVIEKPRVAVIGAGLAGLSAAYRLHKAGVHVDVYEARHHVGGRVMTARVNGKIVELGGRSFADGGDARHIRTLAKEVGIEIVDETFDTYAEYFTGDVFISFDMVQALRGLDAQALRQRLEEAARGATSLKDVFDALFEPGSSIYKLLRMRIAAYEGGDIQELSPVYIETLYHMLLGGIAAAHSGGSEDAVRHISYIREGNALLPIKLAAALGDNLYLGKQLARVSNVASGALRLSFGDGVEIEADKVIFAMPCSVYNDIMFEDGIIPQERLDAIRKVPYGANAKVVFSFDPPSTAKVRIGFDRSFFWSGDAYSPGIALMYYVGEAARFIEQDLSTLCAPELSVVQRVLGDFDGVPTAYRCTRDAQLAEYEDIVLGKSWPLDPFVKGSYSYIAPGQEEVFTSVIEVAGETVKELFAPIDHKIYFAGEHASVLADVPGTMEAACESGERAARMIMKAQG